MFGNSQGFTDLGMFGNSDGPSHAGLLVFLFLRLSIGALLALALVAFLFGWALGDRLVVLGGYHNSL